MNICKDMVYKMLRDECCIDCGGKCSFRGRIRNECWYRYIFVCDKSMYEDCFGVEEDDDDD